MLQGISCRTGHPLGALGCGIASGAPDCATQSAAGGIAERPSWLGLRVGPPVRAGSRGWGCAARGRGCGYDFGCVLDSLKHGEDGQASAAPASAKTVVQVPGSGASLGTFLGELERRRDRIGGWAKTGPVEVVTLGNLCVDILVNVPQLPKPSSQDKYTFVQGLSSPDEIYWEGGGNCNFAIAAARLGLKCVALGHVGEEKFGHFLHRVLQKEGVDVVGIESDGCTLGENYDGNTLVCWVLVDPERRHAFCSRYDYNQTPVFDKLSGLPSEAHDLIQSTRAVFCNGFVYDELSPPVVLETVGRARQAGSAIFFDPGPRGKALKQGTVEQQQSLNRLLSMSDVILLTDDEAEVLTGISEPGSAARSLLKQAKHAKWVVVKLGARGCLLATAQGMFEFPGFEVEVKDTVGCGDSFAAAIVLGYTRGVPVTTTLALANAVGAATAMGFGAGRNVASSSTVLKILAECNVYNNFTPEPGSAPSQAEFPAAIRDAFGLMQKALDMK